MLLTQLSDQNLNTIYQPVLNVGLIAKGKVWRCYRNGYSGYGTWNNCGVIIIITPPNLDRRRLCDIEITFTISL